MLTAVVIAVPSSRAGAQPRRPNADPEVITFSAKAMAAPVPAFRYRFLPELVDQEPGNAAMLYFAAAREVSNVRGQDAAGAADEDRKVDGWLDLPVRELPKEEVRAYLAKYLQALTQYRLATLRMHCDFDPPFRTEGYKT